MPLTELEEFSSQTFAGDFYPVADMFDCVFHKTWPAQTRTVQWSTHSSNMNQSLKKHCFFWQFYTMHFDPIPQTSQIYPLISLPPPASCSFFLSLFCAVYISWGWEYTLEHGQPTRSLIPLGKKHSPSFTNKPQLSRAHQLEVVTHEPLHPPSRSWLFWFCAATTPAVRPRGEWSCQNPKMLL